MLQIVAATVSRANRISKTPSAASSPATCWRCAVRCARSLPPGRLPAERQVDDVYRRAYLMGNETGSERLATLRDAIAESMEAGCGIFRVESEMKKTCDALAGLKERYRRLQLYDASRAWNTEWLAAIELGPHVPRLWPTRRGPARNRAALIRASTGSNSATMSTSSNTRWPSIAPTDRRRSVTAR